MLGYIVPIVAAAAGIGIAGFIMIKKRQPKPLVCPIGHDCDSVIRSEYSRFLGIPVESLGLLYYILVLFAYGTFVFYPDAMLHPLVVVIFAITTSALLFSVYLTFIQIVTLRQLCTWCLASAALCLIIFFASLYSAPRLFATIQETLMAWKELIIGVQLLGMAIALGSATLDQIFFYRFLRDLRISKWESSVLQAVSQITWLGLGVLLLAMLGLFLTDPAHFLTSGLFYAQLIVTAVIIFTDAYTNLTVAPRLVHISFGEKHEHMDGELRKTRKLAFAGSAVSVVSWYTLFILVLLSERIAQFNTVIMIYAAAIAIALITSQITERMIVNKQPKNEPEHESSA